MKLNPKMGFKGQTRPNKNLDLKDQIGLKIGEKRKNVEREGKSKRREEEEEKKRKKRSQAPKRYGTLDYYLDHGIEWIHGTLRLCMINIMSPNLGFSLNCILTLDFLKLRWVKPTRNKISKEFPF